MTWTTDPGRAGVMMLWVAGRLHSLTSDPWTCWPTRGHSSITPLPPSGNPGNTGGKVSLPLFVFHYIPLPHARQIAPIYWANLVFISNSCIHSSSNMFTVMNHRKSIIKWKPGSEIHPLPYKANSGPDSLLISLLRINLLWKNYGFVQRNKDCLDLI